MKKLWTWALLAAALVIFGMLPVKSTDVAELLPARVLTVEAVPGGIRLNTEGGVSGIGETVELAMADLKRTAPGALFLGTVENVIVAQNAWDQAEALTAGEVLRPAAKLYLTEQTPEPEAAQAYLAAHPGALTRGRARALLLLGQALGPPGLTEENGRFRLER